ncbi:MAG: hypothetical protein ACR2PO_18740 [Methyloligellaceae bacterium]
MATILEFRRPEDGASGQTTEHQPDQDISRSAEIIIFPGVRIERPREQAAEEKLPAAASARPPETARRD